MNNFKKIIENYLKKKNTPDYYSKLSAGYNDIPITKCSFGINDINNRIKKIISSLNQYIKYTEVKDSLLFVNVCMLALFNDNFRKSIVNGMFDNDQIISIIDEMQTIIVKNNGEIDKYLFANNNNKISIIRLIKSTCASMKSEKELNIYSLLNFLKDMANKIFPIIINGTNEDKLLISETIYKYIYIYKNGKNSIISTPTNITNFMIKILNLKRDDFFIEFCSGFGNFTLSYLLNHNNINGNKISGIENEDYIYLFYITTLRIIGLNFIQALNGDMLQINNINDLIPSYNNIYKIGACMNPPFGGKNNKIAAKLVLKGCDILPKKSLFAVILPYAFAIGNSKLNGFNAAQFHKDLLKNNTLLASFSLANNTFGATASSIATIFIIKTGIPHFKKNKNGEYIFDNKGNKIPNEKTFLMYCKNDGFKILKNTRIEKEKGLGDKIVKSWLDDYQQKNVNPLKSAYIDIHEEDEWLIEAYMKTDYSKLAENNFEQIIRDFYAYKIKFKKKHNKTENINTSNWKEFKISDLFDCQLGKGDLKDSECGEGTINLISSGALNNGVIKKIDEAGDGKAKIFDKNCITLDMFCNCFYQDEKFYSVSHGRINILIPKFKLNQQIGLFIATILNNEQYRFSYGRAVYNSFAKNIVIKLPVDKNGNPNWKYITNFIKKLQTKEKKRITKILYE